jgi:hypothetical protein
MQVLHAAHHISQQTLRLGIMMFITLLHPSCLSPRLITMVTDVM